jgi:hypothetical protein
MHECAFGRVQKTRIADSSPHNDSPSHRPTVNGSSFVADEQILVQRQPPACCIQRSLKSARRHRASTPPSPSTKRRIHSDISLRPSTSETVFVQVNSTHVCATGRVQETTKFPSESSRREIPGPCATPHPSDRTRQLHPHSSHGCATRSRAGNETTA